MTRSIQMRRWLFSCLPGSNMALVLESKRSPGIVLEYWEASPWAGKHVVLKAEMSSSGGFWEMTFGKETGVRMWESQTLPDMRADLQQGRLRKGDRGTDMPHTLCKPVLRVWETENYLYLFPLQAVKKFRYVCRSGNSRSTFIVGEIGLENMFGLEYLPPSYRQSSWTVVIFSPHMWMTSGQAVSAVTRRNY